MSLTDDQIDRYSRQIILPEVGGIGQEKLLAARVFLAGGATFTAWTARYLAAAGVGAIEIAGAEAELLAELRALDGGVRAANAGLDRAAETSAAIIDRSAPAAGDLSGRAWDAGVPVILVGGNDDGGWITALSASHPASACSRCADAAANAAAPALLATLAATEAIKSILAVGAPLCGRRLVYDRAGETLREEPLRCRPGCDRGAR